MTIVIMKFGGSCLQDSEAFNKIYEITKIYENEKKIYIASAFGGVTDLLLKTAKNAEDTNEVDKNLKNKLTFKDLNLSKDDIISIFIGEGILPKNFLSLKDQPISLPSLKNESKA